MSRILGLDLGANSIGWAIIDSDTNEVIEMGARIIPNSIRIAKRQNRRQNSLFLKRLLTVLKLNKTNKKYISVPRILIGCVVFSVFFILVNHVNWQYWLNISTMVLLSLLTILHQDKK